MFVTREKKQTIFFVLCFFCLILICSFSACSGSENKLKKIDLGDISNIELIDQGKLKVGICPKFSPFEFEEKNKLVGYDIDIAEMIGNDLDLKVEYQKLQYEDLTNAIVNNEVDVAISAINIDPTKQEEINFSTPYYTDQKLFAVGNDSQINSDNLNTYLASNNTRIAFLKNSTSDDYVLKNLNNLQMVQCEDYKEIVDSISENKADICIAYQSFFNKDANALKIIKKIDNKDECAVALKKNKNNLYEAINKDLATRLYDGTIGSFIDKWFNKD